MCRTLPPLALALACAALPTRAAAQDCRSPDVIVTLDASGSMAASVGTSTRWQVAVDGLSALARANAETVRWGLVRYPSDQLCGAGNPLLPLPSDGSLVGPTLEGSRPAGGTPTATSVAVAATLFRAGRTDRPQFHVLVTDGDANCNLALDASTCDCTCTPGPTCDCSMAANCLDDEATVGVVEALAADGVPTFVIGFFGDPDVDVLNRLADAGGTATEGEERFIRVRTPADFVTALGRLEGLVGVQKRPCESPCGTGLERCTEALGWSGCDAPTTGSYRGCAVDGEAIGFQRCEEDGWGPCEGEAEPVEEGCGCAAGRGGATGALGLVAILLARALRRRR